MGGTALAVNVLLILASAPMLYFGAEWLVTGSALVARRMRIRPIVIGLTVVAFATSAPELVVGIISALKSIAQSEAAIVQLALGNVIGANVANLGLIIGASALVRPLLVEHTTWRRDVPITIALQVLLFVFCMGGAIARWEGAVLILTLVAFVVYMIRTAKDTAAVPLPQGVEGAAASPVRSVLKVAAAVVVLAAGGYLLVRGATGVAEAYHITNLVIGATLVASLTTVPELATSIIAARHGEGDIAVGNAVGSVFFNTSFVLGVAATIRPIEGISWDTTFIKIPIMIGLLLLLLPFMRSRYRVSRAEGAVLVVCYLGWITYLIVTGSAG